MQEAHTNIVGPESLERELRLARAAAAGANLLGPHSVTWQVDREAAVFLGAGRALLMQLANPWVAAAIEQHSDTFAHPIRRFHRTFNIVLTMVFGSLEQSLAAARRLHARHSAITGTLPTAAGASAAGSSYHANAVPALRWVHATLVETAPMAYGLVLPPLTADERARYYAESRLLACCLVFRKQPCRRTGRLFAPIRNRQFLPICSRSLRPRARWRGVCSCAPLPGFPFPALIAP
jgi:uncharacterized protein (DUF2236 family)